MPQEAMAPTAPATDAPLPDSAAVLPAGAQNPVERGPKKSKSLAHSSAGGASVSSEPSGRPGGALTNPPRHRPSPKVFPLIPGRLALTSHASGTVTREEIARHPDSFYFSSNFQDRYHPFALDFGPVNLAVVHKFCGFVRGFWQHPALQDREAIYYTDDTFESRTNSAFLLAAFMVVDLGYSPEEAWAPFAKLPKDLFATFRDASSCEQKYGLTVLACLQGLSQALSLGWYDPKVFSVDDYCSLEGGKSGHAHRLSPKFIAFKGPVDRLAQPKDAVVDDFDLPPEDFTDMFKGMGVSAVVRLNEASTYDSKVFTDAGINHHDIYFDDCTMPDSTTVRAFLKAAEEEQGVVAVHCRAGLGRTGTLIAVYFMEHHGFSAAAAIGWLRIVRPGSVLGDQQHFLHWYEATQGGRVKSSLPKVELFNLMGDGRGFPSQRPSELGRALTQAQADRARRQAAAAKQLARQGTPPKSCEVLPPAGPQGPGDSVGEKQQESAVAPVAALVSKGYLLLRGSFKTLAGLAV